MLTTTKITLPRIETPRPTIVELEHAARVYAMTVTSDPREQENVYQLWRMEFIRMEKEK
jgi:hypothetical protein